MEGWLKLKVPHWNGACNRDFAVLGLREQIFGV